MKHLNNTYRGLAILMTALLLVNTFGFAIDMHYCQNQLKSISLLGKAKNCHQMAASSHCASHQPKPQKQGCENEEKGCCNNQTIIFQAEQENGILPNTYLTLKWENIYPEVSLIDAEKTYTEIFSFTHPQYRPPLLFRDIPVFVQNFLL